MHTAFETTAAARLWNEISARYKRQGNWGKAQAVWDAWANAAADAVEPLVERAKYAEWTTGDLRGELAQIRIAYRAHRGKKMRLGRLLIDNGTLEVAAGDGIRQQIVQTQRSDRNLGYG